MLGRALAASSPGGVDLRPMSHEQLDVTGNSAVTATLDAVRPDVVINASGYTSVDRAESERSLAFALNASAVEMLGKACARRGITVLHFSTDYVFDGAASRPYREIDPPSPINCYGESKLEGERALLSSGAPTLLIRTQWLFGAHGASFPKTMWDRARRGSVTCVVNDQRGRPTSAADLAGATWELIKRRALGLFNVANTGEATWHDVAELIFSRCGVPDLLTSCSTSESSRPARRPPYSVLDTTRVERVLGSKLPHWKDALRTFLDALEASEKSHPV